MRKGTLLKNRTVSNFQRIPIPEHWRKFVVFCEDPQAAQKVYGIYPDGMAREGKEYIRNVDFDEFYDPANTDRLLYFGQIPN